MLSISYSISNKICILGVENNHYWTVLGYNIMRGDVPIMEEKDVALRLAKLRAKKGVSARDMSLSLGQNPGYINNIETGKARPSLTGFLYICEYLGVTPSEFFDLEDSDPAKRTALCALLRRLNNRQLEHVTAIVEDLAAK